MHIQKTLSLAVMLFLTFPYADVIAQSAETYDIVSIIGKIVDKRSNRELLVGEIVNFQTELEFSGLHDRAIVLNSEKTKYYLELPKASVMNMQLTVASNIALAPVQNRSSIVNSGLRRGGILFTEGLSPKTLKDYFEIDAFTIIGTSFALPVLGRDKEKFDLMIRYETENSVVEYIARDFIINKSDLKILGSSISECFVYLIQENGEVLPVTQLTLFFVEKDVLLAEFEALLKALKHEKVYDSSTRDILRNYCADVYGVIDRNTLELIIDDFFKK